MLACLLVILLSVEDLIHEEQLDSPILQVCIGKFVPSSPNMLGLAVLHPRHLTVYEFVPQGETVALFLCH